MFKREDIRWNEEKNWHLKVTRGVGFEDVIDAIESGGYLDDIQHPDSRRGHQRLLIVEVNNYVCVVPYVLDQGQIFFKTLYFSRAMNRRYLGADT